MRNSILRRLRSKFDRVPRNADKRQRSRWLSASMIAIAVCAGTWVHAQSGSRTGAGVRATSNGGGQLRVDDEPRPAPATFATASRVPLQGSNRNVRATPRYPPPEPAIPGPIVDAGWPMGMRPEKMISPTGMSSTLNLMLLLTVLSLAPSILMMTTSFIRFVVVFGLLRQALGTQQLPPNQVIIGLSMFLTFMVMGPVWRESYNDGIRPYASPAAGVPPTSLETAFRDTLRPIRRHMSEQIERAGNSDAVWLFIDYQKPHPDSSEAAHWKAPETYDDVPLLALLPAYMLSELKTSFIIGFQIYLPFLVIDMVIASLLMTMGMMMVPPSLVSFPFKLLLFVLIDGWYLTVGMLLESVRPFAAG